MSSASTNNSSSNGDPSSSDSSPTSPGSSSSFQQQQQSLFSSSSSSSASTSQSSSSSTTNNILSKIRIPLKRKRPFKFAMIMPWLIVISCVGVSVMNQRRLKTFYSFQSSYEAPVIDVADTPQLLGKEDEEEAKLLGLTIESVDDSDNENENDNEERGLKSEDSTQQLSSPEQQQQQQQQPDSTPTDAEEATTPAVGGGTSDNNVKNDDLAPDTKKSKPVDKEDVKENPEDDDFDKSSSSQSTTIKTAEAVISSTSNHQTTNSGSTGGTNSPYAYMFVIGGINENQPSYKGFIYNVLVATSQLRKLGSTYDVVLYVQLSAESNRTELPPEDVQHLTALNIEIRTLPKPIHGKETFASLVFEKFRPLEMTEYKRVIFLDADAIPVANLDYIFHLSDPSHTTTPTILRPNLILASRAEACNAGMFMLQPQEGAWDELNAIIQRVHEEGTKLPYPHFDWQKGWGYNFVAEGDFWRGTQKTGNRWKYHAGHSDQGLLYYWTKFYKRDVSIVILDEIENWVDATGANTQQFTIDGKPKPVLETTLRGEPLLNFTTVHPTAYQMSCDTRGQKSKAKKNQALQCVVPYRDFAHFMGSSKPWQEVGCPSCFAKSVGDSTSRYNAATKLWFAELQELDTQLDMDLDFDNWGSKHHSKKSPLGSMAMYYDILPQHKKKEEKKKEEEGEASKAATIESATNNNESETKVKQVANSELTAVPNSEAASSTGSSRASSSTSGNTSPYAYMFVIGGIHEDRLSYKGFIYNVLVATSQLRKLGSTADVVLYYQLSADSNRTELPEEDVQNLIALNIQIRTLPKPNGKETFASLVFEKFRPLEMTEYKRVIFLDADAIPLANLDYIFHLSDPAHKETPTILRPNLIIASRAEACNAGMFMLQPEEGAWDELNAIIDQVHEEGKKLPYPHFHWQRGWGYNFNAEKDNWRGTMTTGSTWKYHAGHSDQGLLYYWTKFYKRDVSIVIQDEVENWVDLGSKAPLTIDGKPKPVLEDTLRGEPLLNFTAVHPTAYQFSCDTPGQTGKAKKHQLMWCVVPYRDFAHFMGGNKPWQEVGCPSCFTRRVGKKTEKSIAPMKLWFTELQELDTKFKLNIDFKNWASKYHTKKSPLGSMAMYSDFLPKHKKEEKEKEDKNE